MNESRKHEDSERLPPHSVEAEQGVLGCIMLNGQASLGEITEVFKGTVDEIFYDLRHQNLYRLLCDLDTGGRAIDVITVSQKMKDEKKVEDCGGIAYVTSLMDMVPSATNLPYYIGILKEKYLLRLLLRLCAETSMNVWDVNGEEATAHLLDRAERSFLSLNEARAGVREIGAKEIVQRTIDQLEDYHRGRGQMRGLSTGFAYLDKMLLGLSGGQMIVLAARPGMGKTSLGMNIIEHITIDCKTPALVFSLEMTNEELVSRMLFQRARGDYQRFRTGFMENEDFPKLTKAAAEISHAPLWIDDTSDLSVMEIRARARRVKRQKGIKVVMVDYMQLIRGSARYISRVDEVADISKNLKGMGKELGIPVIVLCQLNREVEKEKNRIPRLSDLRESGAIEQDADVVKILYKPKISEEEREQADWAKHSDRVNLLVAKQRQGPTGNVELLFHKASMRFESFKRQGQTEDQNSNQGQRDAMPTNEELGLE